MTSLSCFLSKQTHPWEFRTLKIFIFLHLFLHPDLNRDHYLTPTQKMQRYKGNPWKLPSTTSLGPQQLHFRTNHGKQHTWTNQTNRLQPQRRQKFTAQNSMAMSPIEPIATVVTISIQALRSQDFITFRHPTYTTETEARYDLGPLEPTKHIAGKTPKFQTFIWMSTRWAPTSYTWRYNPL